jgi:bifunctional enzyme CysN/CysC
MNRIPPKDFRDAGATTGLLQVVACGSVDDGKSTLIEQLLHGSTLIFDDQLSALAENSTRRATTDGALHLPIMDGQAEREEGNTIEVARRFFATAKRTFIVADPPGHEQFTRNMTTGASSAEFAIVLIDAQKGVLVQTRRHSLICGLLGIRHVLLAVNKMDLVDFRQEVFDQIVADYKNFAKDLGFVSIAAVPTSARLGDNVTTVSNNTPWYRGPSLLHYLETIDLDSDTAAKPFRFRVQRVDRPRDQFRRYAGTVASGRIEVGESVVEAISGRTSVIAAIHSANGSALAAAAGDAITITLKDELEITRGDVLVTPKERPEVSEQFAAHIIWMGDEPLVPGRSYLARIGTKTTPITVTAIKHLVDVNTRQHIAATTLHLNDIAFCNLSTAVPVAFDPYEQNRKTGLFTIVDRLTNHMVGTGLIAFGLRRGTNIHRQALSIGKAERAALNKQRPAIIWFTGLSGAGKSTVADIVDQELFARGHHTTVLDGDNVRHGLNRDLGFTEVDRVENIRRVGEVAKLMAESGLIVLCSFISPYRAERDMIRNLVDPGEFIEVFVDTPIATCIERDPKGLYAKAKAGQLKNFTGIDAPYEPPQSPEIHLQTLRSSPEEMAEEVVRILTKLRIVAHHRPELIDGYAEDDRNRLPSTWL